MNRDLDRRLNDLERTAGTSDEQQARMVADAAWVESEIARIAATLTGEERTYAVDQWDRIRALVKADPLMAKVFAGLTPDDWRLC